MKGLGDLVERVTKLTGLKKVADSLPFDCGCEKRKQKLNEMFPFVKSARMTAEQKKIFERLQPQFAPNMSRNVMQSLVTIYNDIFNTRHEVCNCGGKMAKIVEDLAIVYENSCDEA